MRRDSDVCAGPGRQQHEQQKHKRPHPLCPASPIDTLSRHSSMMGASPAPRNSALAHLASSARPPRGWTASTPIHAHTNTHRLSDKSKQQSKDGYIRHPTVSRAGKKRTFGVGASLQPHERNRVVPLQVFRERNAFKLLGREFIVLTPASEVEPRFCHAKSGKRGRWTEISISVQKYDIDIER